jgi:hypothetical protein
MTKDRFEKIAFVVRPPSSVISGACSSMAEQRPHKALVAGSNPAGPTGLQILDCRLQIVPRDPFGKTLKSKIKNLQLFFLEKSND